MRQGAVAISYGVVFWLLKNATISHWQPLEALRILCLLLVPTRYWLALWVGEFVPLAYFSYGCMNQFGPAWVLVSSVPPLGLAMPAALWLRGNLPGPGRATASRMGSLLLCAVVYSVCVAGWNLLRYVTGPIPSDQFTPYGELTGQYFLGAYLAILAFVPLCLVVYEALGPRLEWKKLIPSPSLALGGALLLAIMGSIMWLGAWTTNVLQREGAQLSLFVVVAIFAVLRGWRGAAFSGAVASIGILLIMPEKRDVMTLVVELLTAFTLTILLLLGAAIQEAKESLLLARQASSAKSQFLAMLSHEIRTPMTGVLGMAELLLSTPLSAVQRDYIATMQRSGNLLLKLVNDALDLARIEAGRLELEATVFSPTELLREVVRLDMGLAVSKGIMLNLGIVDPVPDWVCGDGVRIKQVLLNLVNNALKFTDHGSVCLGLHVIESGLCFSVSDTGPGIPETEQARLFQRFEQVEGPQRQAGSGLGLAICRELVAAMGGHIELASRPGVGSVFQVQLPLPSVGPPTSAVALSEPVSRALQLLLVEDDPIVAKVISSLLESQGHTAKHVSHGLAALAEHTCTTFDAILLDLDLPGVDGFQIARLIRQQQLGGTDGRLLPIIAVTARSRGDEETRTREAGMDGFLRKPVSGGQLASVMAECIGGANS